MLVESEKFQVKRENILEIGDLEGKLVAVLGFGQEGKAVTAYLLKHGVKPVLFDQKPWQEWDEIEKLEIKKLGLNFIFGPDCFKELAGFGVAFRSPGIPLSRLELQSRIKDKGLLVTSQAKWFFERCPAKIIGVTGTKGKGTTASLIYEILSQKTIDYRLKSIVYLTGNIGATQPLEILDDLKPEDYIVYELSSFQLQDLDRSPHIGVVLMVMSEHLDYHRDQEEYIEAKSAITKFQNTDDFAVINADFENSIKIGEMGPGKKIYFSRKKELENGCFVKNNQIVCVGAGLARPSLDGGRLKPAPTEQIILDIRILQLRGAHNLENVCAAVSVAKILGVYDGIIKEAAINFKGLEHRLEFVADKRGVKFYNDSFSTVPETAVAAINSFTEPLVVILGGSSKNSDFAELGTNCSGIKKY